MTDSFTSATERHIEVRYSLILNPGHNFGSLLVRDNNRQGLSFVRDGTLLPIETSNPRYELAAAGGGGADSL